MYDILIVDDFYVDAENIKKVLQGLSDLQINVIGECGNGLEALQFIERKKPDIIITDVEMPFMNGFELCREVNNRYPQIKIIFCSQYEKFEYVKSALYLDGYGYLVKPVDSDEVERVIMNMAEKVKDNTYNNTEYEHLKEMLQANMPMLVEKFIKDLIYGKYKHHEMEEIYKQLQFLKLGIEVGPYLVGLIEIDNYDTVTARMTTERQQIYSLKVFHDVKRLIGDNKGAHVTSLDQSHILIILSQVGQAYEMNTIDDACRDIVERFKNTDTSISMAISSTTDTIKNISALYEQCQYLMKHKFTLGNGIIIKQDDIETTSKVYDIQLNSLQQEIRFLLNSGNKKEIEEYISSTFKNLPEGIGEYYLKNLCFCIVISIQMVLNENKLSYHKIFNDENIIWEKLLKFETIVDAQQWLKNILVYINDYINDMYNHKNNSLVTKVKQYISEHYMDDLKLETIANDLFYSPNYINLIFKKNTGQTIFNYVCIYKIEKAKELLKETNYKLYEISNQLGYTHTAYFSSLFKKIEGITPKEYRERCI